MLASAPKSEHNALNRITFGARTSDLALVNQMGWKAWVAHQLNPPPGDDPELAAHLAQLAMPISYQAQAPFGDNPGWALLKQYRTLDYLKADVATLWGLAKRAGISVAPIELRRIQQELNAVTWVRHVHAEFQIREVMVDFWGNHFSIGRQECIFSAAALPSYDADVIRPNAFGNFGDLLAAVATSSAMLKFLNNAESTAAHPNENYARELLELHTLGAPAYLGLSRTAKLKPINLDGLSVAPGFTDDDVIQASRALSGWTLEQGQKGPDGTLPFSGKFIFNPLQHNTDAGMFMGVDLSTLSGMTQGQMILRIVARHPATADFVVRKLARCIFAENPPAKAIERGKAAWLAGRDQPDQIKRVLSAILTGGPEIGAAPTKVRRPHERIMALLRTTGTVANAYDQASTALTPLGDGMFVWPTPEGRPDHNAQWLTAAATLEVWNQMLQILSVPSFHTNLSEQTPVELGNSAASVVEYWVGRMVGYRLRPAAMQALIDESLTPTGVVAAYETQGITNIERALRRLTALIATSPEFALR